MAKGKKRQAKREREQAELADVKWIEVKRPTKWRFKAPGDELVGRFMRVETRNHHEFGIYQCVLVRTPEGVVYATGTILIDLITGSGLREDEFLKITYDGTIETASGYDCNLYSLQVEDR